MNKIKLWLLVCLFFSVDIQACILGAGSYNDKAKEVSMVELLANSSIYDGKFVTISGVLDVEPRNLFLFINKDSYNHFVFKDSVRLKASGEFIMLSKSELEMLKGNYISITGFFYQLSGNRFSGEIRNLEQMCKLRSRQNK